MNNEFKAQAIKQSLAFVGVNEEQARYVFEMTLDGARNTLMSKSQKFEGETRRAFLLCAHILSGLRYDECQAEAQEFVGMQ